MNALATFQIELIQSTPRCRLLSFRVFSDLCICPRILVNCDRYTPADFFFGLDNRFAGRKFVCSGSVLFAARVKEKKEGLRTCLLDF